MKMNRIKRSLAAAVLSGAASVLLLGDLAQAQPSPVGDWDMTIAGNRRGTAQVTFFSDFTLIGFQINTLPPVKKPSVNPRTGMVEGGNVSTSSTTNMFGSWLLTGIWSFDLRGRVIGQYNQVTTVVEGGTNRFVTNAMSFTAGVRPGRAITLNAQGPSQTVQLRGRPTIPLTDLTGSYYGTALKDGIYYLEFFNLTPAGTPNLYDVVGSGPDYDYSGIALLTRQGQFSINSATEGTNAVIRTVSGPLRTVSFPPTGTLAGEETGSQSRIQFRINP